MSRLQKELRQNKPFRNPRHEAVVSLLRTADWVRQGLLRAIGSWGLTLQQYNVLRILRGAGKEGIPTLEIAARMVEHAPGITRLLDRLEVKGYARRERCDRDRRQVLCYVTEEALRVLAEIDPVADRADVAAMKKLGKKEISELVRLLDLVREDQANAVQTKGDQ